ncbi:MAG TPA: hypothetical protein VMI31_01570 [Fimbriimonadaceae bacterium]|nr:hypothetical protein [Fimbriimonadaceae bacterium]
MRWAQPLVFVTLVGWAGLQGGRSATDGQFAFLDQFHPRRMTRGVDQSGRSCWVLIFPRETAAGALAELRRELPAEGWHDPYQTSGQPAPPGMPTTFVKDGSAVSWSGLTVGTGQQAGGVGNLVISYDAGELIVEFAQGPAKPARVPRREVSRPSSFAPPLSWSAPTDDSIVAERPKAGHVLVIPARPIVTATSAEWRWYVFSDHSWSSMSGNGDGVELSAAREAPAGEVAFLDADLKIEAKRNKDGMMDLSSSIKTWTGTVGVGKKLSGMRYSFPPKPGFRVGSFTGDGVGIAYVRAARLDTLVSDLAPHRADLAIPAGIELARLAVDASRFARLELTKTDRDKPLPGSTRTMKISTTGPNDPKWTAREQQLIDSRAYCVFQSTSNDGTITFSLVKFPGMRRVVGSSRWVPAGSFNLTEAEKKLVAQGYQASAEGGRFPSEFGVKIRE